MSCVKKNRSHCHRTVHLAIYRHFFDKKRRQSTPIIYQGDESSEVFRGKHLWNTSILRNSNGSGSSSIIEVRDSSSRSYANSKFANDRGTRGGRIYRDRSIGVRMIGRGCFRGGSTDRGGNRSRGWEPVPGVGTCMEGARIAKSRWAYINARRTVCLRRAVSTVAGRQTIILAETPR